ncbi:MAG TPA: DegT/DnrJ/EryC1/StrS family aminotransferase [Alphaproteobacteria bacterium]|nr:DegT/DnrJ/EryC1/StrS family aminotransferase [Alphaproteobacteria bacterium]
MNAPSIIPLAEPLLPPHCAEAVARQVQTGFVGPGPKAQEFAASLAKEAGVPHGLTVASGTVALSVAAIALGLRPGDEIVLPAYGVISVINAFGSLGLKPRLADIDAKTGCISAVALEKAITPATRAVCFVDFAASLGPELDEARALCQSRKLPFIEDAAWALGRKARGKKGGGNGDIGITSFSVPKIITTGQGGALFLHDEAMLNKAVALVDQGDTEWRKTGVNRGIGSNLRLSDVSAALGLAQLQELPERLKIKARNHEIIRKGLGERLFRASDGEPSTLNIVFVEEPESLMGFLKTKGILSMRQYRGYWQHPPYAALNDNFKGAQFWTDHAVYLPFGIGLSEEQAVRVMEAAAAYNGTFLAPS